jgi:RNA polymerase sigma-70 factor (ECF subfamily)
MDRPQETELARAVLAGETDAFERFVNHFRSKVFHYSWLMCGRPENIDQLREPERVRPWVFRIAKNACLMQRRKSLFAPTQELSLDELLPASQPADDAPHPEVVLLDSELRAVIDRVVAELPPIYRAVVLLRDLEELSTEDTAHILDLGTDVVKTRLHRGRAAMRQKLDCYLNNHCLEDQPSPNPSPLTERERTDLLSRWRITAHESSQEV